MAESTTTRPGSGDDGQHDRSTFDAPIADELMADDLADGPVAHDGPADDEPADEPHVRWITRRRLAKWNGPRHPRDWRWFVAGVGRTLIATGLLLFGFVAYQLWGTGIETARSQRALTAEFETLLATSPPPPPAAEPEPEPEPEAPPTRPEPEGPSIDDGTAGSDDLLDVDVPALGPFEPGDPVARLEIPRIDVDHIVVSGVGPEDLKKGPGHFPLTPLPGHLGNAALAGHRTTHGQPFRHVDELEPGDEIVLTTVQGTFVYLVTGTQIVSPQDSHVVATTRFDVAELTLVSCHPVLSAAQRIIISAELDEARSSPTIEHDPAIADADAGAPLPGDTDLPGDDVDDPSTDPDADVAPAETDESDVTTPEADESDATDPDTTDPGAAESDETGDPGAATTEVGDPGDGGDGSDPAESTDATPGEVDDEIDDAFARGWFHDPDAYRDIALWGSLLTIVSLLAYGLSRLTRRDLVGFTVGIVPFAVTAFFFFQNVNRLLPPGL